MKNKHGITLISLVITIILLIILASIGINLSIGENGLFNKAKYARDKYINAQETEKKNINDLYSQMLIATNDSSQITISIEDLKTIINEQVKNEVSQLLQNGNIDYSNSDNIVISTKTINIEANSWAHSIEGPSIGAGTWLIFIDAKNNSNKWSVSGITGTGCTYALVDNSHNGQISTSGFYTGNTTTLTADAYNGSSSSYTYTITFKAI